MRSSQPRQPTCVWPRFTRSRGRRKRRRTSYLQLLMLRESRKAKTDYLYRPQQRLETLLRNYKNLTRVAMLSFLPKHLHWAKSLQFSRLSLNGQPYPFTRRTYSGEGGVGKAVSSDNRNLHFGRECP